MIPYFENPKSHNPRDGNLGFLRPKNPQSKSQSKFLHNQRSEWDHDSVPNFLPVIFNNLLKPLFPIPETESESDFESDIEVKCLKFFTSKYILIFKVDDKGTNTDPVPTPPVRIAGQWDKFCQTEETEPKPVAIHTVTLPLFNCESEKELKLMDSDPDSGMQVIYNIF